MKKLFTLIFIALILLNVLGYYGILIGLQHRHAQVLRDQFDAGLYNIDDTEVIKIPFKAPAGLSSEYYERVDGDFIRGGEVYRLIKQRLYRDTFHIVYMKDKTGTVINKVISDYAKTFSDTASNDGSNAFLLPVFLKDYISTLFSIQQTTRGWEQLIHLADRQKVFIDRFVPSIIHPPERA